MGRVGVCAFGVWKLWEGVQLKGGAGAGELGQTCNGQLPAGGACSPSCASPDSQCGSAEWVSAGGHVGRAWGGKGANLVASASDHHVSSLRMFKN